MRQYEKSLRLGLSILLCALILLLCVLSFATLRCGGLTLNQRRRQMKRKR